MDKTFCVNMWYGHPFERQKYYADAYFYPHGSFGFCYRGNIYDENGQTIGDYGANSSTVVEDKFMIRWE